MFLFISSGQIVFLWYFPSAVTIYIQIRSTSRKGGYHEELMLRKRNCCFRFNVMCSDEFVWAVSAANDRAKNIKASCLPFYSQGCLNRQLANNRHDFCIKTYCTTNNIIHVVLEFRNSPVGCTFLRIPLNGLFLQSRHSSAEYSLNLDSACRAS